MNADEPQRTQNPDAEEIPFLCLCTADVDFLRKPRRSAVVPVSDSVSDSDWRSAGRVGGSRERERNAIRLPPVAHALAHADREPRATHEHATALAHIAPRPVFSLVAAEGGDVVFVFSVAKPIHRSTP
jgi:hypothetical protein